MHQNYHFLKNLAQSLDGKLTGKSLVEAFSQEKDEIVLVFAEADAPENVFYIKGTLTSHFSCLSFPEKFDRARKNSVNLFTEFEGQQVSEVRVFKNERAIRIAFGNAESLVFKLFGNRSNLISFDSEGNVRQLFNNKLGADKAMKIAELDREIDQSFEAYERAFFDYAKLFPTLGKEANKQLNSFLQQFSTVEQHWEMILFFIKLIEKGEYYLTRFDGIPALLLFEAGEVREVYTDPIEALNNFYIAYIRLTGLEREKGDWVRLLKKRIQQTDHYLENTFEKLVDLENAVRNEEIGHIIMANLHQIPERSSYAELYDFYRDAPIRIKLKSDLSAQKNAEQYYRKAKNEKIEQDKLRDSIEFREKDRERLAGHLDNINAIESLRELRTYVKANGLDGSKRAPEQADLFKRIDFQGYIILVGRNAKNNDLLTKQYASKEDLWLHAKDVTGSHVVVKNHPGKKIPSSVIERAAELAAFYSKRKNDSLCPVIFTPKKYVRKPKGLPDGAVVVDREEVIMVVARGE